MTKALAALLLAAALPWAAAQTAKKPAAAPAAKEAAAPAEERVDRADLERTQITGSRELPKVLYIVPWKKPAPGALNGRPVQSVLDEALAPVDRDVFRRQMQYDAQLRPLPAAETTKP